MNYLIYLFYNGLFFNGSQSQLSFLTVQDEFIFSLFKFTKKIFKIIFSSRTDKFVNSIFQVLHLFGKKIFCKNNLLKNLNLSLNNILIYSIIQISEGFHSIYSSLFRIYTYIFSFLKNILKFFFLNFKVNIFRLIYFFKYIVGVKNFKNFSHVYNTGFSFIRILKEINFYKKNFFLYIIVVGNSFLYNMLRNLVSYLIYIIYNNYDFFIINFLYLNKKIFTPLLPSSLYLIYIYYKRN